jgi:hypothetical protein
MRATRWIQTVMSFSSRVPADEIRNVWQVERRRQDMDGLFVETWGDGAPVVLVHGSLATGVDEWQASGELGD